MRHNELVKRATDAIEAVFSDTSVATVVTRASLRKLQEEIEVRLVGLQEEAAEDEA